MNVCISQKVSEKEIFVLDVKTVYKSTLCKCSAKYIFPPWCVKRSASSNESFCVLNGGLNSRFCPGFKRLIKDGKPVDAGISNHPFVCNKAKRKLFIIMSDCECAKGGRNE